MTGHHRTLPILARICDRIDELFIEEVGPFGQLVAAESRETWLAAGSQVRTSDVRNYINLLAKEIPESGRREAFVFRADVHLGLI
ncbi:MAG: hypothetical protein WCP34_03590 [Pseudomonadota bacterium]